ncbi:MAG: tetratricopeptide repeat protein [Desulfomonile tiedjei]|uniref:Tetratricopeptide repeat protein n=1 Tax=Desulfomonile tiedjei TaxID=2358 RepID=A0A9D6V7N4_9BACT|nr:tetratricopeptide repeat protein [Desulfomonile tiedjei]
MLAVCVISQIWSAATPARASEQFPEGVIVDAPDGLSTPIYAQTSPGSDLLGIALQGDILETLGVAGDYVQVRLPADKKVSGYVLKAHTKPWVPPKKQGIPIMYLMLGCLAILIGGAVAFFVLRARKSQEAVHHAASIPASIKRAEELYRAGDYGEAIREFKSYIELQGGEVRNPDVYRRLTVCYQNTNEIKEAARSWERMRSLGGLKNLDDYTLGVELMSSLGKEAEAAEIYEQLLQHESDEDKRCEIHRKLFDIYRRIKNGDKLVHHAMKLKFLGTADTNIVPDTIHFLIAEGQTDVAIESNNKELVGGIASEFMEDKLKSPEAGRIYLKALEYDRTDQRLHRILANIYNESGDLKRAVSELTILHQLDKEQPDIYMDEAAKLYVENGRVSDAIAEGNPLIIKKIAQMYLARSEVNPDAVAVYEKVLEFQPKAVGINRMLSTVYLTRGDLDKYMDKLRLLHEIDGSNHDYLSDLAKCIIDNDMIDETIKEGNRDLNAKIVKQLIKRGTATDKAVSLLEKLVKFEPENAILRGALVRAYERRTDPKKAFHHVLQLIKQKSDDTEFAEKAAILALELNSLDELVGLGSPQTIVFAAREIVKKQLTGQVVEQILTQAVQEAPRDPGIAGYLKGLKQAQAPDAKPKPQAEPAPSARPEPKPERTAEVKPPTKSEAKIQKPDRPATADASKPDMKRTPPKEAKSPGSKHEKGIKQLLPKKEKSAPEKKPPPGDSEKKSKRPEAAPIAPQSSAQIVRVMDEFLTEDRAVTTFVSGHDRGRTGREFNREDLLLPTAGGLAYKEMEVLVTDGWGNIHVGMEVNTGRPVLIRVFRKGLLESPALNEFISDISELGFNTVHDNILPLEEIVHGPGAVAGLVHPFFSRTLEGVMRDKKRPDLAVRLELIAKLVDGMAYAHNYTGVDGKLRRTFHLQLQSNLIFVSDDYRRLQIGGLGHSQAYRNITRGKQSRWQEPGMNPVFMPPEFFRSKGTNIKERAVDVYSLGILIYFMATGEYPFDGPALDDYKFQHIRIFAAPPRLIDPTVPDWLEPIILGCLEKEPDKRWTSISEIQQAFNRGMNR